MAVYNYAEQFMRELMQKYSQDLKLVVVETKKSHKII